MAGPRRTGSESRSPALEGKVIGEVEGKARLTAFTVVQTSKDETHSFGNDSRLVMTFYYP